MQDFKEYHDEKTVRFVVSIEESVLSQLASDPESLIKKFKLRSVKNMNLVLFDSTQTLRKYNSVLQVLDEFYQIRLEFYGKRKKWLVATLEQDLAKLTNKARFLEEVIHGIVVVNNTRKDDLIQTLNSRSYLLVDGSFEYLLGMPIWSLTAERLERIIKDRDLKRVELDELLKKTPKGL